jgi:Ca-activated chloride channel family protein
MIRRALAIGGTVVLVAGLIGCTVDRPDPVRLRVLASSELADMQPVLEQARRETGVELVMTYRGTVDASDELARAPGSGRYDLAWLSSERYLRLKLAASRYAGPQPLATDTMTSPVVIGMKPAAAARLRRGTGHEQLSWADIADGAATGQVRFGMADPGHTGSGLAALVGVATAAAGTGRALRTADVSCDRLRGFLAGQVATAGTAAETADRYVAGQDGTDALIDHESALLALNAGGRLRTPLEIIYPRDGIVLSDYPLLLLDPAQRDGYDRLAGWLRSGPAQRQIMERTLRRPLATDVPRDPRLRTAIGNALYFPDEIAVIDRLLADYLPAARRPGVVIFLLDFSGSMQGARMAALRSTFASLSGADRVASGEFARFYRGERLVLMRFAGRVLGAREFTIGGAPDLAAVNAFLAPDQFAGGTAIWSALAAAYQRAARLRRAEPAVPVSVVLMTDGENNAGISLADFRSRGVPAAARGVHTYAIRYGEASRADLDTAARATGGHLVDATATSLRDAVKEIRGCR